MPTLRITALHTGALALLLACGIATAHAQSLNDLKGITGGGNSGTSSGGGLLGGLGGGAIPSTDNASPTNIAGLMQYCVKNHYLNGSGAASVKDGLMSKLGGGSRTSNDSGYKAGSNGLLETGNGQTVGLGGGGIKQQVTNKVCDLVMQHAKSLL